MELSLVLLLQGEASASVEGAFESPAPGSAPGGPSASVRLSVSKQLPRPQVTTLPFSPPDLRAAMEVICDNVGKDWKRLARRLRVSEIKIEAIEEKYPDLVEQVKGAAEVWKNSARRDAAVSCLVARSGGCQLNVVADLIEEGPVGPGHAREGVQARVPHGLGLGLRLPGSLPDDSDSSMGTEGSCIGPDHVPSVPAP